MKSSQGITSSSPLSKCPPTFINDNKKETEDELFEEAIRVSKQAGYIKSGDRVVIVAGVPLGKVGSTNMIRVVYVE